MLRIWRTAEVAALRPSLPPLKKVLPPGDPISRKRSNLVHKKPVSYYQGDRVKFLVGFVMFTSCLGRSCELGRAIC
jgi:hypothetical protein